MGSEVTGGSVYRDWFATGSGPDALSSSGSIYGFNVGASKSVRQLASRRDVPLRLHNVIYKLIDELKEELSGRLPPLLSENVVGEENKRCMK